MHVIASILVSVELNVVKEVMDGSGNSGNGAKVGDEMSGDWGIEIFVAILIFIHSGILLYCLNIFYCKRQQQQRINHYQQQVSEIKCTEMTQVRVQSLHFNVCYHILKRCNGSNPSNQPVTIRGVP